MLNYEYKPSLNLNLVMGDDIDPRVRTSCATDTARTRWNKYGVLERVPQNTPRIAYHIDTGSPLGLMCEQQRTNSCPNGELLGAVSGVVGAGGSLPTGLVVTSAAGLTLTVTGTSVDAKGVSHTLMTLNGVASSDRFSVLFEGSTSCACAVSQRWSGSSLVVIPSGTTDGVQYTAIDMTARTSVGTAVSTVTTTVAPDSHYRVVHGKMTVPTGSERITHSLVVGCSVGTTVSATYKVGLVQLERGYSPSSFIPTSAGPVTRPDEVNLIRNVRGLLGIDQGTFVVEFNPETVDAALGLSPTTFTYTNSAVTDYFRGAFTPSESRPSLSVVKGGSAYSSVLGGKAVRTSSANRTVFGFNSSTCYAISDALVSNVGVTVGTFTYPSTADTLYLGTRQSSTSTNLNGVISHLQVYPIYIEPGEVTQYTKNGGLGKADYSDI